MSARRDLDYLLDIQEAIRRISEYTGKLTFEQLWQDTKTEDAIIRNLEIIGEATKQLSLHLRRTYPQVPWRQVAGLRDVLIHHYFGVDQKTVWTIIKDDLPLLERQIVAILDAEQGS